ncbi:MAG: hypothetical protein ACK5ZS_00605 [bacterium]
MSDNIAVTPGSGATAAADNIGGVLFQRVKLTVGADGTNDGDVATGNPMPVREMDPSTTTAFGPITAADTVLFSAVDTAHEKIVVLQVTGSFIDGIALQASHDATTWFNIQATSFDTDVTVIDTIPGPGLFSAVVNARWFRAITLPSFSGTVSGSYALRTGAVESPFSQTKIMAVDPGLMLPVSAQDERGNLVRVRANQFGQLIPADNLPFTGGRNTAGPILTLDTTGYGSVVVQLSGTWAGTVTFQSSNDALTWVSAIGWSVAGAATPVATSTANGQWIIPAAGRYFRVAVTAYTSGVVAASVVLKASVAQQVWNVPSWNIAQVGGSAISATSAQFGMNLVQVGGTAVVTGGVAGIQAIGGNIAVGSAPTANPVPIGGWDGTNTRRILTDAVSGGVSLGANGASNGASVSTLISAATNNLTQLKSSLGKIFIIDIQNTVASIRYLKLFNLPSSSVTMGTTNATLNFSVPASGKLCIVTALGLNMGGSGISYAITGGSALNDNTAIGAGDIIANFQFV